MKYYYIRAYGAMLGSHPSYVEDQCRIAEKENAPETATHRRQNGTWATIDDIKAEDTKARLRLLVAKMQEACAQQKTRVSTLRNIQTHYRIVLTCYDHKNPVPYADSVDALLDTERDAGIVMRLQVKDELETLNDKSITDIENCEDLPFRADFDGDNDAIVRFWDGDDYQIVTIYNLYPVQEYLKDQKESLWKYRDFLIVRSSDNLFVQEADESSFTVADLGSALSAIDKICLERIESHKRKE